MKKRMGIIKKAAVGIGILAAACGGEIAYFYGRTMKRSRAKTERTMKMSGTDWSQYMPLLEERKAAMLERPHSDVWQSSFDNLKLHATYFPVLAQGQGKKKIVICFHGYTSQGMSDYIGLSDYYQKRGFAMLLPDARAHGTSGGEYVGFGCLDRKDALVWINWVIEELGEVPATFCLQRSPRRSASHLSARSFPTCSAIHGASESSESGSVLSATSFPDSS